MGLARRNEDVTANITSKYYDLFPLYPNDKPIKWTNLRCAVHL